VTEKNEEKDGEEAKVTKRSKGDQSYWTSRLRQRTYTNSKGEKVLLTEYQVCIQFQGRREWFQLGTSVSAAAAKKAVKIYESLRTVGWEKTHEVYKPRALIIQSPTVGEFLGAIFRANVLKPKTFSLYARKLRKVVSDVAGIVANQEKFKHRGAGAHAWRDRVDAVRLSKLTPEVIEAWRKSHILAAGPDAKRRDSAENTANSVIRNARSLFAEEVLSKSEGLQLPKPLPFEGVGLSKDRNAHYVSRINPKKLIQEAKADLAGDKPEQFKIFLLALFCGLRRNEIDKLMWRAVDFEKGVIHVELNSYFTPKAASSIGDVFLEAEVSAILKKAKKMATGDFVIESPNEPRLDIAYDHYRSSAELDGLIGWLRNHGVDTNNPLHTLRKEFGRLMTENHGIYAASKMLRHSSILVTASYYADDQRRLTVGLGSALSGKSK
jgi:integrase